MKLISNIGLILLAVYLILSGVFSILGFGLPHFIMSILAIVAGAFILIGK